MKQDLEADVGSSGAQQCLRGCCRSHWDAVIQQSSPREREHLVASVGVRQPTPRVDIAQSERVRGGGDHGLGLERSLLSPRLFLHKARGAGSAFSGCCLPQ